MTTIVPVTRHGTRDGYHAHLAAGETPCPACARTNEGNPRLTGQARPRRAHTWPLTLPLPHLDATPGLAGLAIARALRESA